MVTLVSWEQGGVPEEEPELPTTDQADAARDILRLAISAYCVPGWLP